MYLRPSLAALILVRWADDSSWLTGSVGRVVAAIAGDGCRMQYGWNGTKGNAIVGEWPVG